MTTPKGKMPEEPKTVAWFKHGPYSEHEHPICVLDDPKEDDCYSPLVYKSTYDELRAYCAGVEADAKRWRGGYFLYFPEYCGHDDSAPDGSGWYHQNITEPRWFKTPNEAMDAAIAQANLDFDDAAIDAARGKISATLIT